ncbi:TPA: hypothetical protein ACGDWK_000714, partial [Acinetobacter baumannii]
VVTFCWLKTNDLFKVDITKSSED